jgi:hypothetical protein
MEDLSPINYLNNKDLLSEIHKSKSSFCEYTDPTYADYDIIVHPDNFELPESEDQSIDFLKNKCLSEETISQAISNRVSKLNSTIKGRNKTRYTSNDVDASTLVFRVLTYNYIPDDESGRKKNPKTIGDIKAKVNFVPFVHYIIRDNALVEVGRSHHKNGEFSPNSGNITDKLADMFMVLVNRYSQKSNWRGYTYVNEMKGQALLHLVYMGLRFNEHKSDNPFAYYTQAISNSFTRVLNEEKQHQDLRDDLLEELGHNPSTTRQVDNDEEIRASKMDT